MIRIWSDRNSTDRAGKLQNLREVGAGEQWLREEKNVVKDDKGSSGAIEENDEAVNWENTVEEWVLEQGKR